MANVQESSVWEGGIYQIETTDPVLGGPDGISNLQAKQLANRTVYLKGRVDQTDGELQNLHQGIDDAAQNAIISAIAQALSGVGVNRKGIADLRKRVLSQGLVVLKNKWVVEGCVLVKSEIRALRLTRSGVFVDGDRSVAYTDGDVRYIPDDDYHVTVPQNPGAVAETYWAYLWHSGAGYRVSISKEIPDSGLKLYEVTVPAGDTTDSLDAVTLTDRRVVQSWNGFTINTVQDVYVALPFPAINAPDYDVNLTVESATDFGMIGAVKAVEKQQNGFKIRHEGSADNVVLRWTLLNVNKD